MQLHMCIAEIFVSGSFIARPKWIDQNKIGTKVWLEKNESNSQGGSRFVTMA